MRTIIILLLGFFTSLNAQTVIRYDYMETWNWAGLWWTPAATASWFTNASVTPTESAVLYGLGNGSSTIEQDWYSLPNVSGLNAVNQYQLKFKLASYTFSNSTATTRGVDAADYVSVQVSTNGGVSYVTELRVTGNSNATWPYTSTGSISHIANGSFTNSAAPAGDVYQAQVGASATGPSTITLNLPAGITQVAVDIYCRVNSAGEEWWIDNVELIEITQTVLPIELVSFDVENFEESNILDWVTASEHNTDYYLIKRMIGDSSKYETIGMVEAAGNSTNLLTYQFIDRSYSPKINYYVLTQFDLDGKFEEFGPIAIDNRKSIKKIIRITNLLGQEVPIDTEGILIVTYSDGSSKKIFK